MIYRNDAIILKSYEYRNTSKIVHVLTEDSRRFSLIAKGARRVSSKFGGSIEPLNSSQIVYYLRKDKDIGILKEATIKNSYLSLKGNLYRLNIAWGLIWVIMRIPDPQSGVFGLLKRCLTFLDRGFNEEVFLYFLLSLFNLNGVMPEFNHCVACGEDNAEFFDIERGGVICKSCKTVKSIPINGLNEVFIKLSKGRIREWGKVEKLKRKKIIRILFNYSYYHLGDWLNRLSDILPFEIIANER